MEQNIIETASKNTLATTKKMLATAWQHLGNNPHHIVQFSQAYNIHVFGGETVSNSFFLPLRLYKNNFKMVKIQKDFVICSHNLLSVVSLLEWIHTLRPTHLTVNVGGSQT